MSFLGSAAIRRRGCLAQRLPPRPPQRRRPCRTATWSRCPSSVRILLPAQEPGVPLLRGPLHQAQPLLGRRGRGHRRRDRQEAGLRGGAGTRSSTRAAATAARIWFPTPAMAAAVALPQGGAHAFDQRFAATAKALHLQLANWYGLEGAKKVKYAEAFEVCEYGRIRRGEELRKLFPFFPSRRATDERPR